MQLSSNSVNLSTLVQLSSTHNNSSTSLQNNPSPINSTPKSVSSNIKTQILKDDSLNTIANSLEQTLLSTSSISENIQDNLNPDSPQASFFLKKTPSKITFPLSEVGEKELIFYSSKINLPCILNLVINKRLTILSFLLLHILRTSNRTNQLSCAPVLVFCFFHLGYIMR